MNTVKRILFFILILSFSVLSFRFYVKPALAEAPSLSVSPSIMQIDLNIDEPNAELVYKNNSNYTVELTFSAQDFRDLEDGRQVRLLEPKDAANYKYSLSSWISFDNKSLVLSPGEKGTIVVSIDKKRLTQGGHYASIQAEIKANGKDRELVKINGILSSLLFVRSDTGKAREDAKLSDFRPIRNQVWEMPRSIVIRLENTGNIDITPYGLVEIKDPFGQIVSKGILNEGSLITLPESIRRYDIPVKKTSSFYLPGIYRAKLSMHYGKSNRKITRELSFFSQGSIDWVLVIPGLIILIFALRTILGKRIKKHESGIKE